MAPTLTVLGGGFAGLAAVDRLARLRRDRGEYRIALVDRHDHATFAPTLPDLVSRRIRPEHMAYPLEPHCRMRGAEFVQAEVTGIDPSGPTIETSKGPLHADRLLVALGCENNYFGNAEMVEKTLGLKTIAEGLAMARVIADAIRRKAEGTLRDPLNIVVVGGGYTGIELAAHTAYAFHRATGRPYRELKRDFPITVLELGDEILRNTSENTRQRVYGIADDFGVAIRTGLTIDTFPDPHTVRLTNGETLEHAVAFWSTGVTPGHAAASIDVDKVRQGRLKVDDTLRLEGHERLFAAGDVAGQHYPDNDEPLRLSVQFSMTGGRAAAENMVRSLRGEAPFAFHPFDPGYLVPLAPGFAAGTILGREFAGFFPFLAHYGLSIGRSWGWTNRIGMLMDLVSETPLKIEPLRSMSAVGT